MTSRRWYGTSQRLPDGRVFIIGGANVIGNIAINNGDRNNPTYEFWPRKPGEGSYYMQFLADTVPFNLYPFVHLLPSGLLYIFAGSSSVLLNYTTNSATDLPDLNDPVNVFRLYPVTGTSALLPLTYANNYKAEVIICGGGTFDRLKRDIKLNYNQPAVSTCARIAPEDPNPQWNYETMPFARVMPDSVLLVDGSLLILNGASKGFQGLSPSYAGPAVHKPVIYDYWKPAGSRFFTVQQGSPIARVYHSSALILPDAYVLVSGSNPNPFFTSRGTFPTEFRVEIFAPPYLFTSAPRPILNQVPRNVTVGSSFLVTFNASQAPIDANRFRACMLDPGFSTHSHRHGMRYVDLQLTNIVQRIQNQPGNQNTYEATVKAPPSGNIAPAGIYWFHILDRGVPNMEGVYVRLQP